MPPRLVAAGPALLAAGVLVATVIAFAVAERIKLEPSPILQPNVGAQLSVVCRCPHRLVPVAFTVRRGGSVAVKIVDGGGDVVRHLQPRRYYGRRDRVALTWDGRDDGGRRVADGEYRPRIELGRRTIVMPNTITVDTRAPRLAVTNVSRRTISPDGDGRIDAVNIEYTTDEPARASLFVDGKRYERKKRLGTAGTFRWSGKLRGQTVREGRYTLRLRAGDAAGNFSAWSRPIESGSSSSRSRPPRPRPWRLEVRHPRRQRRGSRDGGARRSPPPDEPRPRLASRSPPRRPLPRHRLGERPPRVDDPARAAAEAEAGGRDRDRESRSVSAYTRVDPVT